MGGSGKDKGVHYQGSINYYRNTLHIVEPVWWYLASHNLPWKSAYVEFGSNTSTECRAIKCLWVLWALRTSAELDDGADGICWR